MATVRDFVRKSPSEAPGPAHPCDAPGLSPIEFLQAVYRDPLLPMSIRIDAARGLLPYTEPRPTNSFPPRCTIVIPPFSYEPWSEVCSPWPREEGRAPDPTRNRSENLLSPTTNHSHDADPGDPQNLTTNPEPSLVPDYSTPPSPTELQEIKAAINKLRPDLAHLPTPEFHLCPCGHWIVGECGCPPRDPSKMN